MRRKIQKSDCADIFKRYYFGGESQKEIGDSYGVTASTISNNIKYFTMESVVDYMKIYDSDINKFATHLGLSVDEAKTLIFEGKTRLGC